MFEKFADGLKTYSPRASQQPWWRIAVESIVLAGVLFVLYLPYYSQPTLLDEFDNMVGGNVVAHGGAIYVDYLSQHTPVAYWLSALGHALGADSFAGQRLFGFALFAVLLAGLYARNVRQFGRLPMLVVVALVPMLHFYNHPMSYMVLSDNYQAIMCLYLLFEVVGLGIRRDTSLQRWIAIGLVSAFSIGVAFISIYYVAGAVLTAAVLTVIDAKTTVRGVGPWVRFAGARAGAFIAPFALIVGFLWATGALAGAYEQAYVLNRSYYAPYLVDGLGSSVVTPLYSGFVGIGQHLIGLPQLFAVNKIETLKEFTALLIPGVVAILLVRLRVVLGVGVVWMASLVATRGWSGFHAQPWWAFVIGCLGILIWFTVVAWKVSPRPGLALRGCAVALGGVVVIATLPYLTSVYAVRETLTTPITFPDPNRSELIRTLVPEGGTYGELGIHNVHDFVETGRMPAGGFIGVVPWFSDMLDDEMADALAADNPVLIFSDESNEVWGYNVLEKAPALAGVIERDYVRIDVSSVGVTEGVYIRTDAVEQSLRQLKRAFPDATIEVFAATPR